MGNFFDFDSNSARPPLWLDSTAYTSRLLEGGRPPWLDVATLIAWQRKAQGLVRSDVIALPAEPIAAALIAQHPQLRAAMAGKTRPVYAIRTLLAAGELRDHLVEILSGLRGCFPGTPLGLVIPSPRNWILLSYAQAFGPESICDAGADEVDSASMYVADFLRAFSECGLDVLLLDESASSEPATCDEIEWYRPVLNVASHYRWNLGLRLPVANFASDIDVPGIDFVIAPRQLAARTGIATPATFWDEEPAPQCPPGQFRYAEIPADANPENVLDRLKLLQ